MTLPEPSTLNYADDRPSPPRRSIVWTILALPTLVIPFVNFACDTSPVDVLLKARKNFATSQWSSDDFLPSMLAVGVCLGAIAFVWRIRVRLPWNTTVVERLTLISFAALAVVGFLASTVPAYREKNDLLAKVSLATYLLTIGFGVFVIVFTYRRNTHNAVVLACLLSPFLSASAYATTLFAGEKSQIGWYLTAIAAPITLIEMIFLAKFLPIRKDKT